MSEPATAALHLPDEIALQLGQLIDAKKFSPGDRLPSERDLCEQFSVSRPVIREAISRLKSEGVVSIKRGVGVFVTERDPREGFKIQKVDIEEKVAVTQIMELIATVEVSATRLAAARRTSEDLKQIRRCLLGMEYAIASDRLGDEEDFEFHQAIVVATHNPYFKTLSQHLEHTARKMIRSLRSNTKTRHTNLIEAVQAEHQAIYNAIVAGDPIAAELAARTHLENAEKRFVKYLKS
ncbi:FadR family transcriptional regulator [Orrella sp. NBD-18]|uniref:FadR family transcriptional regulator n=1 Tax=Sheuella amnicola TaxID=2707330 RepID=A0A6B2QUX6_9BURK|nr:FadR/GntR family transcriptional regulator [Sheuella amnicola]NDY82160.1 FadR family transcriptional regulator [Sheuella amnicola]HBI83539.1 FadR family transcriptional regulator [Alcaligenaceae bacterium]